ncbi:hypothetical protein J31TS4_42520 [Paenibacillus sp. J31TS4]|uniref:hypothetical protein n=1 Tax=Paenibacillus sp. J31TS4 TaxID=2807195 RepID=UPI001B222650|nr:hypothetical protein [Paenibacillus sp. J31TS4]GIP40972.1 hypothetical protein J31TS4_42520 [Paenibacillus sp. J31TS4]
MIRKRWALLAAPVALGAGLWLGSIVVTNADAGTQPGSIDDPAVTKSYVDQKIKEALGQAGAGTPSATPTPVTPPSNSGNGTVTVVELQAGQQLYAAAGTEVIVRNGKAIAISNDDNTIPDVTAGKDLVAGTTVSTNHLLLFPREGRGIKADPSNKTIVYVMVKGSYLHLNADGTPVK